MALTDGTAYWKLDESSGNAADATGNSNTLTNNNTVTYGPTSGIINNGALFVAATSQTLSIINASQTGLNVTGDYSWSFWLKLTSLPSTLATQMNLFSKYNRDTVPNGFDIYIGASGAEADHMVFEVVGDGVTTHLLQARVNTALVSGDLGVWHYWTVVFQLANPATVIWYKDGSSVAFTYVFQQITSSISSNTAPFIIGANNNNSGSVFFLNGAMDEVGTWARQLSGSEVTQLYNGGVGLQYPFTGGGGAIFRDTNLALLGVGQ